MKVFARTPLDIDRFVIPHGQVYLLPERCKGCRMCVDLCPQGVLEVSNMTNSKGYHLPEIKPGKERSCVNCEFCMYVCPEFAIFSLPFDEKHPWEPR